MNRNWTTKEEYLQFVQDWKQCYKELSGAIRNSRRGLTQLLAQKRAVDPNAKVGVEDILAQSAARKKTYEKLKADTGIAFWNPTAFATQMLDIRKEEKVRAGLAAQAAFAKLVPLA